VHKLFCRFFWIFTIFDRNFAKIVAPPSDENENYVALLKALPKKMQTASKSDNKWQRNACSNYAPLERTVIRTRSMTKKQKKHHIFAPTAGAHSAIFPKLCMVIELVVPIIKGDSFFDLIHSFSARRQNVDFGY